MEIEWISPRCSSKVRYVPQQLREKLLFDSISLKNEQDVFSHIVQTVVDSF